MKKKECNVMIYSSKTPSKRTIFTIHVDDGGDHVIFSQIKQESKTIAASNSEHKNNISRNKI